MSTTPQPVHNITAHADVDRIVAQLKAKRDKIARLPAEKQAKMYGFVFDKFVAPKLGSLSTDDMDIARLSWISGVVGVHLGQLPQEFGKPARKEPTTMESTSALLTGAGAGLAGGLRNAYDFLARFNYAAKFGKWPESSNYVEETNVGRFIREQLSETEGKLYEGALALDPTRAPVGAFVGKAGVGSVGARVATAPLTKLPAVTLGQRVLQTATEGAVVGAGFEPAFSSEPSAVAHSAGVFAVLDAVLRGLGGHSIRRALPILQSARERYQTSRGSAAGLPPSARAPVTTPPVAVAGATTAPTAVSGQISPLEEALNKLKPEWAARIRAGEDITKIVNQSNPEEVALYWKVVEEQRKIIAAREAAVKAAAAAEKKAAQGAEKAADSPKKASTKLTPEERALRKAEGLEAAKAGRMAAQQREKEFHDKLIAYRQAVGELPKLGSPEYEALKTEPVEQVVARLKARLSPQEQAVAETLSGGTTTVEGQLVVPGGVREEMSRQAKSVGGTVSEPPKTLPRVPPTQETVARAQELLNDIQNKPGFVVHPSYAEVLAEYLPQLEAAGVDVRGLLKTWFEAGHPRLTQLDELLAQSLKHRTPTVVDVTLREASAVAGEAPAIADAVASVQKATPRTGVYYHETSRDALQSILKEGIRPGFGLPSSSQKGKHGVFAWPSIEEFVNTVGTRYRFLVEFETVGGLAGKARYGERGIVQPVNELFFEGVVPAQNIKRVLKRVEGTNQFIELDIKELVTNNRLVPVVPTTPVVTTPATRVTVKSSIPELAFEFDPMNKPAAIEELAARAKQLVGKVPDKQLADEVLKVHKRIQSTPVEGASRKTRDAARKRRAYAEGAQQGAVSAEVGVEGKKVVPAVEGGQAEVEVLVDVDKLVTKLKAHPRGEELIERAQKEFVRKGSEDYSVLRDLLEEQFNKVKHELKKVEKKAG